MSRPRYVVATVSGYATQGAGSMARAGVSAHVCDTVYLHEVVATYRSEDFAHKPARLNQRIGTEGALAMAEAHAERLNRDTA